MIFARGQLVASAGLVAAMSLTAVGCSSKDGATGGDIPRCMTTTTAPPPKPPDDKLSPTRVLRRIALALHGQVPAIDDYEALGKAPDKEAVLQKAIDDGLASTD